MRHSSLALASFLTLLSAASGHEHVVVPLNENNFEDATQAASGQTTGFWLVYFGKEDDVSDQKYWETFAEQQREAQPWLLHGHVNIEQSPMVAERFSIEHTPAFILFRNRKMYRFPDAVSSINPQTISALEEFTSGGWRQATKEEVPIGKFSLGLSKKTIWMIVGGAALSSVLLAVLGDQWGKYMEKNRPVGAKATKGQ